MIYIGDLSKNDAMVLSVYARDSKRLLEFGVGASTQIFRNYSKRDVTSLETSPEWIERTANNLKLLEIEGDVNFCDYYTFQPHGEYDLIFSDGADEFRLEFALKTWDNLSVGGKLIFHDTRRQSDINNVAEFIKQKSSEIEDVAINIGDSNLTVISKRKKITYENWNEVESKPAWLSGYEEVNEEELKKMMENDKL